LQWPRLKLTPANITAFLNGLQSQMIVTPNPLAAAGSDADGIVFIEAALATTDRTIVTGNFADYPPGISHGVRVLTPAQAAAELAQPRP
jgi:hypothetical protein